MKCYRQQQGLKTKHLSFITLFSWNQRVEEWSRVEVKESQKCNSCELEKDNFIESVDDLPFMHLILLVLLWGTYVSVYLVFSFYTFYLTNDEHYVIYLSFTKVFESSAGDFKWAWFHQISLNITMTVCMYVHRQFYKVRNSKLVKWYTYIFCHFSFNLQSGAGLVND